MKQAYAMAPAAGSNTGQQQQQRPHATCMQQATATSDHHQHIDQQPQQAANQQIGAINMQQQQQAATSTSQNQNHHHPNPYNTNSHQQQQTAHMTSNQNSSIFKKDLPANGKKTKGRVRIKMEFIHNKLRRYTTFSKRKTGIMKKVNICSIFHISSSSTNADCPFHSCMRNPFAKLELVTLTHLHYLMNTN